jgi:hypothetical protein
MADMRHTFERADGKAALAAMLLVVEGAPGVPALAP